MTTPIRLFVAVWPSPTVRDALTSLGIDDSPTMRAVPAPNWHVTLRFIGDADPDTVVDRLTNAELPTVEMVYGPEVIRLPPRQTVVPVSGVDPLAAAVIAATHDLGEPPRPDFVGHLTIGRTPRRRPERADAEWVGRPFAATQSARSCALVASDLGATGAAYRTIADFPTC